jgi:outer membrane protein assembly factor BamB
VRAALPLLLIALAGCAGRGRVVPPAPVFPLANVWTVPLEGAIDGDLATDGERLFVALRDGRLRAIDPVSGAQLWEVTGRSGRIAAAPGVLVVGQPDGTVWGIDAGTGSALWKAATGIAGGTGPVLGGDLVLWAGSGMAAIERASGKLLWVAGDGALASALPVRDGDRILIGERDGTLRCRSATDGRTLWSRPLGGPVLADPIVDDKGRVLVGTTARAFVALKGRGDGKRLWRWKLGADVQTPAAVLGKRVFVASFESVLYALNRGSGHVEWRTPLPSRPRSGPLLVGSAVVVACQETDLVGYDARTGKRLGGMKVPASFATSPLLLGRRLYVGLRDRGALAAFELPNPTPSPSPSPSPAPDPAATPAPAATASPSPTPAPTPTPVP